MSKVITAANVNELPLISGGSVIELPLISGGSVITGKDGKTVSFQFGLSEPSKGIGLNFVFWVPRSKFLPVHFRHNLTGFYPL